MIIYIIAGIIMSSVLMIILCAGIISFGKLIAITPDGRELRGEVRDIEAKKLWSSPEQMPKYFAGGLGIIFVCGCGILLSGGSIIHYIFGGMTIFTSLFFAGGLMAHELLMYNQMISNIKSQRDYAEAIRS